MNRRTNKSRKERESLVFPKFREHVCREASFPRTNFREQISRSEIWEEKIIFFGLVPENGNGKIMELSLYNMPTLFFSEKFFQHFYMTMKYFYLTKEIIVVPSKCRILTARLVCSQSSMNSQRWAKPLSLASGFSSMMVIIVSAIEVLYSWKNKEHQIFFKDMQFRKKVLKQFCELIPIWEKWFPQGY